MSTGDRDKDKGGAEGVEHFGSSMAGASASWPDDLIFVTREERPSTRSYGVRILARLSARASLPRIIRSHALRRCAATSLLRQTGDLDSPDRCSDTPPWR